MARLLWLPPRRWRMKLRSVYSRSAKLFIVAREREAFIVPSSFRLLLIYLDEKEAANKQESPTIKKKKNNNKRTNISSKSCVGFILYLKNRSPEKLIKRVLARRRLLLRFTDSKNQYKILVSSRLALHRQNYAASSLLIRRLPLILKQ